MTTKEYLNQIRRYEMLINDKLSEIYRLRQLVSSVSISTDSERVMSSGSQDRMGDAVSKIVDLQNEVAEEIESYTRKRQEIISRIDMMQDINHHTILFERYVLNNSFEKIADNIGYSIRQIFRIHGEALSKFEKMYGEDYICQ